MQIKRVSALFLLLFFVAASWSSEKSAGEYLQSGQAFYDKKDWKSAVIEFKNTIKQDPEIPQARALLGKTYLESFSVNAFIKELIRARGLRHDPGDIMIPPGKAYAVGRGHRRILDEITVKSEFPDTLKANIMALRAVAYLGLKKKDELGKL